MKRKCLFKKWIPKQYLKCDQNNAVQTVPGTGCFSEMDNCGYFHQWGLSTEEDSDSVCNYTVGIIEQPSGHVCEALPSHIRFVQDFPRFNKFNTGEE